MPSLAKPTACAGCPLDSKGVGFAPAEGPINAPLLLVGEALGKVESLTGRLFVGDAGGMLQRLLGMLGWDQAALRIHNAISCRPPGDWFDERAPWYYPALTHCRYLDDTLAEPHSVVVPLGQTALKRVLGLVGHKKVRVQDFHGTIQRDPTDRFWVVPSFHPSFLQRGAHNLIGTVIWDLQQADRVARSGRQPDPASLVCDPPIDWFRAWVDQTIAARQVDPASYPVSCDIETPDKAGGQDEGELSAEDRSYQIIRVNVACHPDEGITVPFEGAYIDELRRLLASPGHIWVWSDYDFSRLVAAGLLTEADAIRVVDLMWLWHVLQSDLPRGLGFVAPFYSTYGAWKHHATDAPVLYAAIDALQTHRCGFGITRDLLKIGMLDRAMRHTHLLYTAVLRPAQLVGVQIDQPQLAAFKADLIDKARHALGEIQACIPEGLRPLTPKQGLTRKPLAEVLHIKASVLTRRGTVRAGKPAPEIKQELYAKAEVVEKLVLKEVLVCRTCGVVEVPRRHRCKSTTHPERPVAGTSEYPPPQIELDVATVTRWFWREPLNPDSPQQILAYIRHRKHLPGKAKKTHADTTNRDTLERLARTTKDPFYRAVLDYRAINKVKGTYVEGTERRLDEQGRLHPRPTFRPSTMRLSYVDPNITNIVADKGGKEGLAAGFRRCMVAGEARPAWLTDDALLAWMAKYHIPPTTVPTGLFACRLVEVDFSAIEAVLTAYRAGDKEMLRLAQLGIHAALASHVLGRPYDSSWSDDRISAYFAAIKKEHPEVYDAAKRFIHGRNYGLTRRGMMLTFPELFPTEAVAKRYETIFEKMAPKIPAWQRASQRLAARQHYLGGTDHPYGYRHWFWSVFTYRRLNTTQYYRVLAQAKRNGVEAPVAEMNGQYFRMAEGTDAKRALAFFGQSTGAGVLKETLLRLLADPASPTYVGEAYFGRTPLRAPIHDSGLFEIPEIVLPGILQTILQEFTRPVLELPLDPAWELGEHLGIGVAAKVGLDWEDMQRVDIYPAAPESIGTAPLEDVDEDDWQDLGRAV